MYLFEYEAVFEADPDTVWKVWTDVAGWPEWDVSKEIAQLDGPFEPGTRGWAKQRGNLGGAFTVTVVDHGRRWVTECPVPLGTVTFSHLLEPGARMCPAGEESRRAGRGRPAAPAAGAPDAPRHCRLIYRFAAAGVPPVDRRAVLHA